MLWFTWGPGIDTTGTSREDVRDVALATPYFHSQSSRYLTIWPSGPWTSQCMLSRFYYPGLQSILVRAWLVTVSGLLDQNKHSRRKKEWLTGFTKTHCGLLDFGLLVIQTLNFWPSRLLHFGLLAFEFLAIQTLDFWPSRLLDFWTSGLQTSYFLYHCLDWDFLHLPFRLHQSQIPNVLPGH